jgi:hypothetical protein
MLNLGPVTNEMLRGEGIPIPGRWSPSKQQVLHWVLSEHMDEPLVRHKNHKLCDNANGIAMVARESRARHCDRCLFYIRRTIAQGKPVVLAKAGVDTGTREELVLVKLQVLIDPSEYAESSYGGRVKAGQEIAVGMLRASESVRHIKVHEVRSTYVPYVAENQTEVPGG